jgi:GMP synthase (glutamine-hydrolysing)
MAKELVVVLDFGGQYNQLIARRVRELSVYSEILPYDSSLEEIRGKNPKAIILAGGSASVHPGILELGVPVLELDYDSMNINTVGNSLRSFLFEVAGLKGDWQMSDFIAETIADIKDKVGDKKVLCGLSGGVDSSVAAVLVHKAVGEQLVCVYVDTGLMRKGESEQVIKTFQEQMKMNLVFVPAADRFLKRLQGVTDPERKRKIIGEEFIRVFEEEKAKLGEIDYLVQGTIYPDIVESGTSTTPTIKSHHNVGGLPEDMDFKLIEPLRLLFKDEVRLIGEKLNISPEIVWRQPFPGPGLGVRVLEEVTKEKVDILCEADAIVREEIKKAGLEREIWQAFAVLPPVRSVGVKGDARTYAYPIIIRAVISDDAMTAEVAKLPWQLLEKMAHRIVAEVDGVNRVAYDITSKPPGTIEWE